MGAARWWWWWCLVLLGVGCSAPRANALDPRRALTQYGSKRWGPEDGLPCHDVLSVIQSSDGYLWLGTEEGLVRFDGVRASVFDHQTDPVLGGNNVASVVEEPRHPGRLLLGSANGVTRWVDGKVQAHAGPALAGQPGRILLQDPTDGALWVRTPRGLFQVGVNGEVSGPMESTPGWPPGTIRTVCRDGAGRLWVGTAQGLYRQRDGGPAAGPERHFDPPPGWEGKAVDCLATVRAGHGLWVGSRDAGTGRLDEDGTFHPQAALAGRVVTALLEDRAGTLWVGTSGSGLFRLPGAGAPLTGSEKVETLTVDQGLISSEVRALCEDREGNLWIATQGGLQMLRDVRFVTYGRPEGLAGDDAYMVWENLHGQLWVGHSAGVSVLSPSRDRVDNYPTPPSPRRPSDRRVFCVGPGSDDAGSDCLLLGTRAGLLRWREGRLEAWSVRGDLDGSAVHCLCRDADGNQWVGTDSGLYQLRDGQVQRHLTTTDGLTANLVRALHADRHGHLWIGTLGGLSRLGPDGRITNFLSPEAGPAAPGVISFYEDPPTTGGERELFVGTERGLYRLRPKGDGTVTFTSYTTREGLFDDMLWSLLSDGQGNLWMSSNKGVSRVARADLDRLDRGEIAALPTVVYGAADGLRSRECNGSRQPAAWRDHAGRLWFATVKGAACVDPAQVAPNPLLPPVHVEELLADGRPVGPITAGAAGPELAAGTAKFELRYTALSLVAPEANRFRYRLEGLDVGWTDAGGERTAHYTNLAPGRYTFRVQAANADGRWNQAGAALPFNLRPFFYQTAWFRLLVAGFIATLGWGWLRWHKRHLVARLARAEADVAERTRHQAVLRVAKEEADLARAEAERASRAKSEFLSRVSHELRTPLNAILGFGQLLELDAGRLDDGQRQSVEHILRGGRHLLGLVDEVLDLARIERGQGELRVESLALAPLLADLAGLVEPLARERGLRLRLPTTPAVNPADAADGVHVLADAQRLRQVLLNLLANAIKYHHRPAGGEVALGCVAGAGTLPPLGGVSGRPGEGCLRLTVRDNGPGIAPEDLTKLFIPFERLGAAYGCVKGTGLGLSVSRQLVEAMGGTIGVESTLGVGSTFWVELPQATASSVRLTTTAAPSSAHPTRAGQSGV